MADDQYDRDAERARIRERYLAQRAQLAAMTPEERAAEREAEIRHVRETAAALRRTAA